MLTYSERIISLIHEIHPYEEIDAETRLIESGILDSLSLINLIALLEEDFDIEIDENEIIPSNFISIGAIGSLLDRIIKQSQ